ncbi:MAG: 5-formyltetrahydrofolate cyclo-ligase [Candidatus Cloacimonetes bacterium]|nr:5-formyltetrahydrofolate cyclo-ligase [Candidatus Cloacimonadota bacterium]
MMKPQLRKTILAKRKEISPAEYRQKSDAVCEGLQKLTKIEEANTIHVYYPINQEVDIRPFIEYLWTKGKMVIMPRADFGRKEMENYYVISFGQLEETKFGLHEPRQISPLYLGSPDIVIVPGVAFSQDHYRLGYGGGFYDRFLSSIDSYKIGVGFEMQVVKRLPIEEHDQQLDLIITEDRTI